jgi:hypothetical protein
MGRLAGAEESFRALVAMAPDDPRPKFGLSVVLLQRGAWAEAWPLFEHRRALLPRRSLVPVGGEEWLGGDVSGARIAVVAEQGLGDQIMFGRYLADLKDRGADVIVALTVGNSASLFESLGCTIASAVPDRPVLGSDLWTYFGSLPLRLGRPTPPPPVYIPLPHATGGGIGVVATGDPLNPVDKLRSVPPHLEGRLNALGRDLRPQATGLSSMLDTARLIAGLDLVVTVCTAVAHLALSMGKPTWVVLSQSGIDYRWNDGRHSQWYPQARLFRQERDGEWEAVLDEVEAAVREHGLS